MTETTFIQHQIQADLVDRLFKSLPAILVNLTLMPIVVCAVMWKKVPHQFLLIWLLVAFLVLTARFILAQRYAKYKSLEIDYRRWANYFTISSFVSGLTWGFAGWVFFQPEAQGSMVFLYVCIIGLAAGSIIVTSYWLPAYYAFTFPSIGLSAIRLIIENSFEYQSLAILILMYLIIITRVAHIQNQSAMRLAELRFENIDLVKQLKFEKQIVETTNLALDQRVKERTIELENEIVERKKAEEKFDKLAHYDALTNLPNRLMFAEMCAGNISVAALHHQLAILFIDLDRFKEVNDTLGHAFGDQLLIAVVQRLITFNTNKTMLARLGGDEFIYILKNVESTSAVQQYAKNIIDALSEVFNVADHEIYISASIGISIYPQDGNNVDTLVRNADTAMYFAKANGRGRSYLYSLEMTQKVKKRLQMDRLLRHAISNHELSVHYQLKVDSSGSPSGAEALMRWNNPILGNVPPSEFILLSEETGFIVTLGYWILSEVCQQIITWQTLGVIIPVVSVNLSVKQIEHGNIVARLQEILQQTGLSPSRLELEITESIIMNVEDGLKILNSIAELGVRLSIDDFGTGYSSLAYIKTLPINTLKIDRSFVAGIGINPGDESIIHAIAALANSLQLTLIAEGVETYTQIVFLKNCGVQEMQGYYFAKPETTEIFYQLWQTNNRYSVS